MKVFVLGGTGSIGAAIVQELADRSHHVVGLSRSERSDKKLMDLGAKPKRGDLRNPVDWAEDAMLCDAIVQVSATFEDDMGDVDAYAMSALMTAAQNQTHEKRLIYTGGCWLYGETSEEVATEDRPFNPLPSFAWMVENAEKLLAAPHLSTAVIHPAMVYHADGGGVFSRFLADAKNGGPIEIWGHRATRWPLIERTDLARAYCDLIERPDLQGYFNAVAEEGVPVGDIASAISEHYGSPTEAIVRDVDEIVSENGAWARGPTLDQQMSGQKLVQSTGWQPQSIDYRLSGVFDGTSIQSKDG